MTVLNAETAVYVALKFVPEGWKITVYTKDQGRARTNIVAELRKEPGGGWDDWQIIRRPATADDSLLPATWPHENPAIISSRTLADTLDANSDLWADIDD
jgi:hypothetical protein